MKIQPADTSYTPPIRHGQTAQNGGSTEVPAFQSLLVDAEKSSAAKDILADYELHDISWNEIQILDRKLYDAGVFDGEQMLNFTMSHFFVHGLNGQEETSRLAAEKIDYPAAIASAKSWPQPDEKSLKYLEAGERLFLNLLSLQPGGKDS